MPPLVATLQRLINSSDLCLASAGSLWYLANKDLGIALWIFFEHKFGNSFMPIEASTYKPHLLEFARAYLASNQQQQGTTTMVWRSAQTIVDICSRHLKEREIYLRAFFIEKLRLKESHKVVRRLPIHDGGIRIPEHVANSLHDAIVYRVP